MSAERLREAAGVLRERAEAATPGPWGRCDRPSDHSEVLGADVIICGRVHETIANLDEEWYLEDESGVTPHKDADYIATMSPPVALALADWLASEAARGDERTPYFFPLPALELADAILGGTR